VSRSPVAFDLETTYLGLDGSGRVASLPVGPDFWRTVSDNPDAGGMLVTVGTGAGDWEHWEMHPAGDEVLVLLEGRLRMIFERPGGEEAHALTPGATLIVPAGVWHRAAAQRDVRMLFMTYGAGTQHKPVSA
jgi:mannose-6-phosphate isomerase-like protein (cupin superfamily)